MFVPKSGTNNTSENFQLKGIDTLKESDPIQNFTTNEFDLLCRIKEERSRCHLDSSGYPSLFGLMDSGIGLLDSDSQNLATPFSVKNILNLNCSEHSVAGQLAPHQSSCVLDSYPVSICSSPQNAAVNAAMNGYNPVTSVSPAAGYHHLDATGLMMGHHHGGPPGPHPGHHAGGLGASGTGHGVLTGGLEGVTTTSSSCEYGGSTLLHHPGGHPSLGGAGALSVAPPAAAPVPPSYSSLPDLTQATLRLGSEYGLPDTSPPPPVTSPGSAGSLTPGSSINLCPSSRDSTTREIHTEKSEYFIVFTFSQSFL